MCIKESEYIILTVAYLCKFQVFAGVTNKGGRHRCQGLIRSVHLKTEAMFNAAICNFKKKITRTLLYYCKDII